MPAILGWFSSLNALWRDADPLAASDLSLGPLDGERLATTSKQLLQELRRALRGLRSRLPQYELPKVEEPASPDGTTPVAATSAGGPEGLALGGEGAAEDDHDETAKTSPGRETIDLFPPGLLATLRILPAEIVVQAGRERRVRAVALDRDGRRVEGEVMLTRARDSARR